MRSSAHRLRRRRTLFGILLVGSTACGGGGGDGGTAPPTPPTPTTASVSVSPVAPTLPIGGTVTLVATPRASNGAAVSGRAVSWSSATPTVASVNGNGGVTGISAGTSVISATIDGIVGTTTVTVLPPPVATITVSPADDTLLVRESTTFVATLRDATGAVLNDRTVSWESADPEVATITDAGVVTAVGLGRTSITARSEGVLGVAALKVDPQPPASLTIVGGDEQTGLVGRYLADSLAVRVTDRDGFPIENAVGGWTRSGGNLEFALTSADADGVMRARFRPPLGDATATVTVAGLAPVTFRARGRIGGTCGLVPSPETQRFSLGPTDLTLSLDASRALRIAVVFVDYPNRPATESPAALMSSIVEPGLALLRNSSYNRLNVTAVAFPTWYRLPANDNAYTWSTFAGHRAFLLDVLAVSDAAIDYSTFDALFVFSPNGIDKVVSPTFNGGTTSNVVADGRNFGNAVTFGNDSRTFGPSILAHEFGHMLGLVDLYAFSPAGGAAYPGNQFKFVGAWSLMSNVFVPGEFLGWEKRKLGWIDADQVACLDATSGVEAELTPNQDVGGTKLAVVPLTASKALVVEARRNSGGLDANLCASGVLLYTVDAAIATGAGPAQVVGARLSTSGDAFTRCGPWADATFGFGPSPVSSYTEPSTGTTVTVLGTTSSGAYRVRVKRP